MKNLKKRIFSGTMAGALAVSLVVPAFATASPAPNTKTNITGAYEAITIDVTVPTTGTTKINPYGLPVKLDTAGTNKIVGQQIVSMPLAITNNSDVNLAVDASVTGVVKGDLKLAAEAPSDGDTAKNAFVYLQMAPNALAESDKDTADGNVCGFTAATINAAYEEWNPAYDADKDLVVGTRAADKAKMVYLKATEAGSTPDSDGNYPQELVAGGSAFFRLSGQVVADPKEAWTAKDGFTANVAFTFKPDSTRIILDDGAATPAAVTAVTLDKTGSSTPTATVRASLPDGLTIDDVAWSVTKSSTNAVVTLTNDDTATVTVTWAKAGEDELTVEITASNGIDYVLTIPVTCTGT